MPIIVPQLELDIAHVCNLHCFGCAHYSNYTLKGLIPLATAGPWLTAWAARLTPRTFTLLGGEPSRPPDHPAGWMSAGAGLIERVDRRVVTAEAVCRTILTQPGNQHVDVEIRARRRSEAARQILRG